MNIDKWLSKIDDSPFHRWVLNRVLWKTIPFNKPHGLWLSSIGDEHVQIEIPYKKSNKNHLNGLHACLLATAGKYASGLLILRHLGVKKYRIIMKTISADYVYQGKKAAYARFDLTKKQLTDLVIKPLESQEAVTFPCDIPIYDKDQNLLCTVTTKWQVKPWSKVKTKT